MGLLQEEEISELTDILVEALIKRCAVIPLRRLVNLAGEDARAKRDAQINAIHHNVECLRDAQDGSSFRRLKDWLKPVDQVSKLESSTRVRGPTTCEWFLEHPIIEEWIRTGGLCWFHGGMGTGKTFIMSHLIQTMIQQGHVVAYYYFEFTNPSTLSEEALLHSLVFQLSPIHPQTILALHEKHQGGATGARVTTLLDSIVELMGRSDRPFYIAIDALDELPPTRRMELFKILGRMSVVASPNMHIVVSSRDEIDIISTLGDLAQHKLDVLDGKVRHDIAVFVDQELRVEKWKHWPPDLIERMRISLNERAAGQFRMVACQLEVFHRAQTSSDLESRLVMLPRKLADTYHYILEHLIPEEERMRAQTLLRILTASFEAVPLNELAALIAVDLGDPLDVINLPQYRAQQQFHQPQNIVGLGTAFVRLTVLEGKDDQGDDLPPYPRLQLSHASVKEYLLQQAPNHWCYMTEQLAHSTTARACLAVLLHNESSQPDAPVHIYVRQRWFQHVQSDSSDQLLTQQVAFFEKFPWSQKNRFAFVEYPHDDFITLSEDLTQSPVIAASAAGLYRLLQVILVTEQSRDHLGAALRVAVTRAVGIDIVKLLAEEGANVNQEGGTYGFALQAAAAMGTLDVVEFLLQRGADVNKEGGRYEFALHIAALKGHFDIVKLLVEKGADVNKEGISFGSALHIAVLGGYLDVVKFLVDKGADVNKEGGEYRYALQAAAWEGCLDIAEFLVEKGADVNKRGGKYGSAWLAAAWGGHVDVVKFLAEKGADVNKRGIYGSALQLAAWGGHLDVVKVLVENGEDVNRKGGVLGSALRMAAGGGYVDVVEFLVDKGADVNKQGGSALQAASAGGHLDVVEFFVEKGADVNTEGGSALPSAASEGRKHASRLFPVQGTNVHNEGGSALQVAAGGGHMDVVKFLVEKGAEVNKGGGKYGSALHAAACLGHLHVVKFLVEHGADVNKEEGTYGTASHAASCRGLWDVANFLSKVM
ncbi:ankyrin repeat-containing domain protein [Flagelloscypha sp. PMI_526]|nr:ankyrin repeat-containing domain protein [Flagelloscypha sp. PMI_526]